MKTAQDLPSYSKGQRLTICTPPHDSSLSEALSGGGPRLLTHCVLTLCELMLLGALPRWSLWGREEDGIFPESHCLLLSHASPQLPLTALKCRDFLQRPGLIFTPPVVSSVSLSPRNAGHVLIATSLSILSLLYLGLMGLPHLSKQDFQSPVPKGHGQRPKL